MYSKDRKIKKTIRLDQDIVEAIEAFKNITNLDFTKSAETLIARGLENVEKIEEVEKKLITRMKQIEQIQKQDTDRIVKLLIAMTRNQGRIYGLEKLLIQALVEASNETVSAREQHGIKQMISYLKWDEEAVDHD